MDTNDTTNNEKSRLNDVPGHNDNWYFEAGVGVDDINCVGDNRRF